jgi:hypothetical protein
MPRGGNHYDVGGDYIQVYLNDIGGLNLVENMLVGRVTNHFGSGRFQVTLYTNHMDVFPEKNCILCGRLRARFNRGARGNKINAGSIVLVQNNGLSGGREYEILAVFNAEQLRTLKGINKNMHESLTKIAGEDAGEDAAFEFEDEGGEEQEIDINNI